MVRKHSRKKTNYLKTFPWVFASIFLIALIVRMLYYFKSPAIWWDEAIYVGMAKNLFSNGILGYWENFRPPVLPTILGMGWFVGIPILLWANSIQIIASMSIILLVYALGEKIQKHAGIIAAAIVMVMPVFLSFGDKILTSIPATSFALLAIWLIHKKKWYFAGLTLSLAFLTRYVMGIVTAAVGIAIVISWLLTTNKFSKKTITIFAKKTTCLILGFSTTVIPYLIINWFMFKDILFPFKEGNRVFSQYNNWLYDLGNIHYIQQLFIQNYLLIFFIAGLVAFALLKKWKEPAWNSILLSAVFLTTYFFITIHKESRFMIPVWILLSILAGFGITWVLNLAKKYSKLTYRIAMLILIIAFLFTISYGLRTEPPSFFYEDQIQQGQYKFYTYFENGTMDDKLFITSNPTFVMYTDKPYTPLRSWELSNEVHRQFIDKSDYIAIDQCDHPCEQGDDCNQHKNSFLDKLYNQYEVVFEDNYTQWDKKVCKMTIWKTEKIQ